MSSLNTSVNGSGVRQSAAKPGHARCTNTSLSEIAALRKQLGESDRKLRLLTKTHAKLKQKEESNSQELLRLRATNSTSDRELLRLRKMCTSLKTELTEKEKQLKASQARFQKLEGYVSLSAESDAFAVKAEKAAAQLRAQQDELRSVQDQNALLQEELTEARRAFESARATLDRISELPGDTGRKLEFLSGQNVALREQKRLAELEAQQAKQQAQKLESELEEKTRLAQTCRSKFLSSSRVSSQLQTQLEAADAALSRTQSNCDVLTEYIEETKQEMRQCRREASNSKARLKQVQSRHRTKIKDLEDVIVEQGVTIDNLQTEKEHLQLDAKEAVARAKKAEAEVAKLMKEHKETTSRDVELQDTVASLQMDLDAFASENDPRLDEWSIEDLQAPRLDLRPQETSLSEHSQTIQSLQIQLADALREKDILKSQCAEDVRQLLERVQMLEAVAMPSENPNM